MDKILANMNCVFKIELTDQLDVENILRKLSANKLIKNYNFIFTKTTDDAGNVSHVWEVELSANDSNKFTNDAYKFIREIDEIAKTINHYIADEKKKIKKYKKNRNCNYCGKPIKKFVKEVRDEHGEKCIVWIPIGEDGYSHFDCDPLTTYDEKAKYIHREHINQKYNQRPLNIRKP